MRPRTANTLLQHRRRVQRDEMSGSRLTTVVLAAGSAMRFGVSKQLADFEGSTLVARAVRAAEAVSGAQSVLVVGDGWQRVHEASAPLTGFLVMNDAYATGMASSIAAAVRAVRGSTDAILLTLCDQPLVGAAELESLVDRWRESPESLACSSFVANRADATAPTIGPPAVFPARFFGELEALSGDSGARAVLERHRDDLIVVPCATAGQDVDTPADLAALRHDRS